MPQSAQAQSKARRLQGRLMHRAERAPGEIQPLIDLLDGAKRAVAKFGRFNAADEHQIDANRPRVAGINGSLPLADNLAPLFGTIDHPAKTPGAMDAGAHTVLATTLLENCRVYRAGAAFVPLPKFDLLSTGDGEAPAFQEYPSEFVTIDAGPFTAPTPDENGESTAPLSTAPVHAATIERGDMTQYVLRYEIKRSAMRRKGVQRVAAEIYTSLVLGLGRVADRQLLAAVTATNPAPFTLAGAAASGLRYSELAGIIGTDGAFAHVGSNGELRVLASANAISGPPAELTADMAGTIVGAWDRSALAISESIDLMAERTNAAGHLVITCWLDVYALVPDPAKFWVAP